jgi:mannosyltransferase OCH1-like enzyme
MTKIIHQIWLGPNPVPAWALPMIATWRQLFPDWTYKLWTDADLPALLPHMMCISAFEQHAPMGYKVDILRLEVLRLYGGLYVDIDFEALANFEPLLLSGGKFVYGDDWHATPCNALLYSPAQHPFLAFYLAGIERYFQRQPKQRAQVEVVTGPDALWRALNSYVWSWDSHVPLYDGMVVVGHEYHDFAVYWPAVFYPYSWRDPDARRSAATWTAAKVGGELRQRYPHAVAVHHWKETWKPFGVT